MNRKLLLWIASWIVLSLGGCTTAPRVETSKACAEWRWIGIRSAQEALCPDIPGWTAKPLFAPPPPAARERAARTEYGKDPAATPTPTPTPSPAPTPSQETLAQLQRFCVYETDERPGRLPFPPTANGKLVRVDQDCAGVSISGNTEWVPSSDRFFEQAGKPAAALDIRNQRGVRLAFLDTQPTSEHVPPKRPVEEWASEHGYTLAHMARNLICSPEDSEVCAAMITTRLALPIQQFDSRSRRGTKIIPEEGGQIGTQSDLARAIREEVDDWLEDLGNQGAPQHLVLNLSVGWDGELFGGLREEQIAEMRAGSQAVYWALRYARDLDVLVLAAAGNACKGRSEGPLLPAAWEEEAPGDEACGGHPAQGPLVYAVGGVDERGIALANARLRAMPPRAAYGREGVVPALTPGHSTNMYTGTSVATAVVSSIAAIVWDTLPDRSSHQIMDLLEQSGENLSAVRASFWRGAGTAGSGSEPPVSRISLCTALQKACKETGALNCPLRSSCEAWQPDMSVARVALVPPSLRTCHPWVHTQPPEEPCPVCEPPRN